MMKKTLYSAAFILMLLGGSTLPSPAGGQPTRVMTAPPVAVQSPAAGPSNSTAATIETAPRPVITRNPNGPQADKEQPPAAALYSGVEFDIHTGADDLRNNGSAWTDISFPDGSKQTCTLKLVNADSWNNGSQHIVECHLNTAKTYDDLRNARILIEKDTYKAWPVWDYDNWNVDSVKITAKDPINHSERCVWQAGANPLIRLTGETYEFTLEDYDTTC